LDGPIKESSKKWIGSKKKWIRYNNDIVALKCLDKSSNLNEEFLNEV